MRTSNKYKIYIQSGFDSENIPESFHQRILNFKRPKWEEIQKIVSQKSDSKKSLVDNLCVKTSYKNWDKVEKYYSEGLKSKNAVYTYFDKAVGIKHIDKSVRNVENSQIQETFLRCMIKPIFRVDILLAKLGFFCTSYQARQSINYRSIRVNNKVVYGNTFIRKGDIITLSDSVKVNVNRSFRCFSPTKKVFSFVEVDYYSNIVVITKDLSELHLEDLYLLSVNNYNLKKIKDFF